jgi:hypothetical protein
MSQSHEKIRQGEIIAENVSSTTLGAASELFVSASLMRKGFHIFRALSGSCPWDIIAMKDGSMYSIEVKTGYYNLNGTLNYYKYNIRAQYVAVYIPTTNEVLFVPDDGIFTTKQKATC